MSFNILLFKKKTIASLCYGNITFLAGRNSSGKICVRAKKKLTKRKWRVVDFNRDLWNIPGIVLRIEYDPFRSSFLALISYSNFVLSYIICPENLLPGMIIFTSNSILLSPGNSTYLKNIPLNLKIFNIESFPSSGSVFLRSAGCFGEIIEKYKKFCLIKFNNGKIKQFSNFCLATIGTASNISWKYKNFKNAGQKLLKKKKKSIVRGVAKNAVDHPHGGGKGKKSPKSISSSPWGKLGKNKKTKK